MIYPNNYESKIGFDTIRHLLKEHCISTLGKEKVDEVGAGHVRFEPLAEDALDACTHDFVICRVVDAPVLMGGSQGHELSGKRRGKVCHTVEQASFKELLGKDEIDVNVVGTGGIHVMGHVTVQDYAVTRSEHYRLAIHAHVEGPLPTVGDEHVGVDVLGDGSRIAHMECYDMATVGKLSALSKEEDLASLVGDTRVALGDVLVYFLCGVVCGGGSRMCGCRELADVHNDLHEIILPITQTHIVAGQ